MDDPHFVAAEPSEIRIVFFDAVGTLIYLSRGVGFHYADVASRFGARLNPKGLDAAFKAAWNRMPDRPATLRPRFEDDKGWWRLLVGKVVRHSGLPRGFPMKAYFDQLYAEFAKPGVWSLYPEVSEVLEALSGDFELGIISNFDGRLRTILDQLEVARRFKRWVISSEIGSEKPDITIFQEAAQLAGVRPEQAMHVGNDPLLDGAGAEIAGFAVHIVNRPEDDLRRLVRRLKPES